MTTALTIPAVRRARLPLPRRAGPPPRSRASSRSARRTTCQIHVSGGEFNCRRQPGRLLRPADRHRHRDGRLPDRRPDRRARAGDGRAAVLQDVQARRRQRARTWRPSTATAASACARRSSSTTARNEAAAQLKPGDFDWKAIFGGGVRWFHSGGIFAALSATTAELIIEGDAGRQGGRRGRLLRPELPREAVEHLRRRSERAVECSAASSRTSTCWSATKRTCRRASASRAGGRGEVEARSERLLRHDRPGRREASRR